MEYVTPIPHPWAELRSRPHLTLHWADLPHGIWGLTDGTNRIWMQRRLLQRERRATLAHELEHIRRGHTCCQPPTVERRVRHHAARWLLPDLGQVLDELIFHRGDFEHAAEALWVDRLTVQARLDPLHTHPAEKALIRRRLEEDPCHD
ncbi:ImmA/IrrE family metallo-endopeptidase [Naumannella sp. ID2617S]|nr:ImmA/IrrE family metallo-endopeptidase [Naumannella sp. ID2617S]